LFARAPLLASKTAKDPHIPAHINVGWPDDRYAELKVYILEITLDKYQYIPVAYVTMHYII